MAISSIEKVDGRLDLNSVLKFGGAITIDININLLLENDALTGTIADTRAPPDYPAYVQACIDEGIKFIETAGRSKRMYAELAPNSAALVGRDGAKSRRSSIARVLRPPPLESDGVGAKVERNQSGVLGFRSAQVHMWQHAQQ